MLPFRNGFVDLTCTCKVAPFAVGSGIWSSFVLKASVKESSLTTDWLST